MSYHPNLKSKSIKKTQQNTQQGTSGIPAIEITKEALAEGQYISDDSEYLDGRRRSISNQQQQVRKDKKKQANKKKISDDLNVVSYALVILKY